MAEKRGAGHDTLGNSLFADSTGTYFIGGPDWSPSYPNTVAGIKFSRFAFLNLDSLTLDAIPNIVATYCKWSPDGNWLIGYDRKGYFVIRRDGSYKLYLTPGG